MTITKGVVLVAAMAAMASAAPVIEFHSTSAGGHTGQIRYDPRTPLGVGAGTGNVAIGQNIDIDTLKGVGTVLNNGSTVTCFSCTLAFQTGSVVSDTDPNLWSFNGGGFFQVTGGLDLNGNNILDATDIQPGTLLLQGVFNTPVQVLGTSTPDVKFTSATLINTMDVRVDALFGNPGTSTYDGVYTQSFDASNERRRLNANPLHPNYNRWRFGTYTAPSASAPTGMMDGSVINTLVVPEPVSVLLSSTVAGILILCLRNRRRLVA